MFRGWHKLVLALGLAGLVALGASQVEAQSGGSADAVLAANPAETDPYLVTLQTGANDIVLDISLPPAGESSGASVWTDAAARIVPTPGSSLLIVMGASLAFVRRRGGRRSGSLSFARANTSENGSSELAAA